MKDLNNQFKKGILSVIVLKILSKKNMYGYEIIQYLDKISIGYYTLKEGTLYPLLYRLEDNNWIESYRNIDDTKRKVPRKYYKITTGGKKALKEQLKSWNQFNKITNNILEGYYE